MPKLLSVSRLPWGAVWSLAADGSWLAVGCEAEHAAAAWTGSVRAAAARHRSDHQPASTAGPFEAGEERCSAPTRRLPILPPCKWDTKCFRAKGSLKGSSDRTHTHLLWLVSVGNSVCRLMSRASRLRQQWDRKRSMGSEGSTDTSRSLDTALSSPAAMLSGTTTSLVCCTHTEKYVVKKASTKIRALEIRNQRITGPLIWPCIKKILNVFLLLSYQVFADAILHDLVALRLWTQCF